MARVRSYTYEGNQATMNLEEGAWTDNDAYKAGGSWATPLHKGDFVMLSADWQVASASTDAIPIGKLVSEPQGDRTTNGRSATVLLFGDRVEELELVTSSGAVALSASVAYTTSNTWTVDASANDTMALVAAATVSIAAGSVVIPVLMGTWNF